MPRPLPTSSGAARRRALEERLKGRDEASLRTLRGLVEDAELVGSLALAGIDVEWEAVRAGTLSPPAAALRRAQRLFPFDLLALCNAVSDGEGLRREALGRAEGPPTAPPERIEPRLQALGSWLEAGSVAALPPPAAAGLVLVRVLEISPLARANGRLGRLVAAYVMASRGELRPVLVAADRDRLTHAVLAAFAMNTAPLVTLLAEASDRAADVMLQAIGKGLDREPSAR
jgi:hypothetical protein